MLEIQFELSSYGPTQNEDSSTSPDQEEGRGMRFACPSGEIDHYIEHKIVRIHRGVAEDAE